MREPEDGDKQFLDRLNKIILENLTNENFGVKDLAYFSGMSMSALNHKLRSDLNKNINQFIREVRLQKALELLQQNEVTASEVSYRVGFHSPAYFTKCFHEYFGFPPGHFERKNHPNNNPEVSTLRSSAFYEKVKLKLSVILKVHIVVFITAVGFLLIGLIYSNYHKKHMLNDLKDPLERMSVAVMPFRNLTGNDSLNGWQIGIQDILVAYLSENFGEQSFMRIKTISWQLEKEGISDLKNITRNSALSVSKKLGANFLIYGSFSYEDSLIHINSQIIYPKNEEILQAFEIRGSRKGIIPLIDTLSINIKNFFIRRVTK